MFVVYILCLVSVLAPFASSKTALVSFDGKTYPNDPLIVKAFKNGIVNGPFREMSTVRTLTLHEKLMVAKLLRKLNDILSKLEKERVKKLVEREIKLEKLFRGKEEEKQRIENIVPQVTKSHEEFKDMLEQNKIPNDVESDSETMQYGGLKINNNT